MARITFARINLIFRSRACSKCRDKGKERRARHMVILEPKPGPGGRKRTFIPLCGVHRRWFKGFTRPGDRSIPLYSA